MSDSNSGNNVAAMMVPTKATSMMATTTITVSTGEAQCRTGGYIGPTAAFIHSVVSNLFQASNLISALLILP